MALYSEVKNLEEWLIKRIKPRNMAYKLSKKYGYKPYMIERYREIFESWSEVKELLKGFERPLSPSIRCNRIKVENCTYLARRLELMGFKLRSIEWCDDCFTVEEGRKAPSLGSLHEFLLGMYYLYRGLASLIPPLLINPNPSDVILDMAAAPGGKTTHMAQIMNNQGVILATDVSRSRMRALRSNIERLGITNTVLLRIDGRLVPEIYENFFTKVLLDAPCSGEGLIAIDRSRKRKTSLRKLLEFRRLQIEMLNSALEAVAPGGLVLYTTCSIAPEENELVIADVLTKRKDVNVLKLKPPIGSRQGITHYFELELPKELTKCVRLFPHISGTEGFFMCLLRRIS